MNRQKRRLLTNGFTTAASTLAGSTKISAVYSSDVKYQAQKILTIEKITVHCGGTTIAPAGTDGLVSLRYGDSSDVVMTTMTVCPQPFAVGSGGLGPFQMELSDLNIQTKWFEFITRTTCEGGVGVYCFGY